MGPLWDVLGFGAVAVDDLIYVDEYPPADTKVRMLARRREGGGLTGTALVAAARLGARAAYCGVLGDDELSRFTLREFEREGVDCASVLFRPGARPIYSVVIVSRASGQRNVFTSHEGVHDREPHEITDELIQRARVLFVDHTVVEGSLRAVEIAHRRGTPVVGDFESGRDPRALELLRQLDHLIVGESFARQVTGRDTPADMVRALAHAGRVCTIVTAGERGCWYAERGGEVRHRPAFRVDVVDTTGCGDVFHGAYAACVARGDSVDRAIQVATATAGLKTTQPGGRSGIPDWATVEAFLTGRT